MADFHCAVWGKRIAYKTWHTPDKPAVLALHGWLDNAGSFDRLAPLLEGHHIIAPDLAGHGLSDHRSADSAYNLWQDAGDMAELITQIDLPPLILMGHSRGAMAATLLAAMYPEMVRALVLLDGLMPAPVSFADTASQLRQAIADRRKYLNRPPRRYPSVDDAMQSRLRGPMGLSRAAVATLACRGLARDDKGYYWRADSRLRGASEIKLTAEHSREIVRKLECPTLLLAWMPVDGFLRDLAALNGRIHLERIGGGHHFHLEGESCGEAAARIGAFLREVGR